MREDMVAREEAVPIVSMGSVMITTNKIPRVELAQENDLEEGLIKSNACIHAGLRAVKSRMER